MNLNSDHKKIDESMLINSYLSMYYAPAGLRYQSGASPPVGAGDYSPWNPSDSDVGHPQNPLALKGRNVSWKKLVEENNRIISVRK